MPDQYRSYVVRVRRHRDERESLRLEIEDLLGGARQTLSGAPANDLSRALDDAIAATEAPAPAPDDKDRSGDPAPNGGPRTAASEG
jgi:hypothetical protein